MRRIHFLHIHQCSALSIEGSSEPFRAFLGAILSVVNGVPVSPCTFDPDGILDVIPEEQEQDAFSSSENDLDDGSGRSACSGAYCGSSKGTGSGTRASLHRFAKKPRKGTRDEGDEFGLMVCPLLRTCAVTCHVHFLIHSDYCILQEIT
jgi:hypothetical protein